MRQQWEAKLKESGFEDLESTYGSERYLKRYDSYYFRAEHSPLNFKAIGDFYRIARHACHTLQFKSEVHAYIWKCFAHGYPQDKIAAKTGYHRRSVRRIIDFYRKEAGL